MISAKTADAEQPGEQAAALGAQREGRRRGRAGAGAAGRCRGRRAGPGRCRAARDPRRDEQQGERGERRAGAAPRGRAPANGRSSSAQPSGVAHRSQPADDVSATIRRSSATASAAPAIPMATAASARPGWRRAPTPTKTGSGETSASERKTEGRRPARPTRIPASSASHTIAAPERDPGERGAEARGARLDRRRRGRAPGGRRPPRRAARAPPRARPTARRRSRGRRRAATTCSRRR